MMRSWPAMLAGIVVAFAYVASTDAGEPARSPVVRAKPVKSTSVGLAAPATKAVWSCAHCHSESSWKSIPKRVDFDHDRTGVPLTGAHERAPCVGCHQPHTRKGRVPRACVACHTDAHRGEQGQRCDDCHTSASWRSPRRFDDHASGRFPLSGAHAMLDCRSCHRGQARDQYRGTPTTCDACHRRTALAVTGFAHAGTSLGCNRCHNTFAWSPARFSHDVFWPLVGGHAAIAPDCKSCHPTGNYAAASRACAACHSDKIAAGKTHPDHASIGLTHTCERCHTAMAWNRLKSGWHEPAFPINGGKHGRYANNCGACHPAGVGKGRFDCIHCHDGEHSKAKMDDEHQGKGGYVWSNPACMSCHPEGRE